MTAMHGRAACAKRARSSPVASLSNNTADMTG